MSGLEIGSFVSGLLPVVKESMRMVRALRNVPQVPKELLGYSLKFEVESQRFRLWAEHVFGAELYSEDLDPFQAPLPNSLDSRLGITKTIYDVLATVHEIFQIAHSLYISLGLQIRPLDDIPAGDTVHTSREEARSRMRNQLAAFQERLPFRKKLFFKINTSHESPSGILENLHEQLVYWNLALRELVGQHEQNSSDAALLARMLATRANQLEHVERATEAGDTFQSSLNRAARFKLFRDRMEGLTEEPGAAERRRIDFTSLNGCKAPENENSRTRSFGTHAERKVLVEWKTADGSLSTGEIDILKLRLSRLASSLAHPDRPDELRALECVGSTSRKEEFGDNLGLIYRYPPFAKPSAQPRTLYRMFSSSSLPSLPNRFQLAKSLAVSLMVYHSIGWIHKAFTSANILFFQNMEGQYDFSQPFVSGFEYSRPDDSEQLTFLQDRPSRQGFDPRQHPEVFQGGGNLPARSMYHRRYDIYSLGVMLLEIAF